MNTIKYAIGGIAVTALIRPSTSAFSFITARLVTIPMTVPIKKTMSEPPKTIPSVVQPPYRILDKMQRPNASVPNGYSALGVAYLANKFDSIGSLGANRNPIKKNTITSIGMKSIHHFRKRIAFI